MVAAVVDPAGRRPADDGRIAAAGTDEVAGTGRAVGRRRTATADGRTVIDGAGIGATERRAERAVATRTAAAGVRAGVGGTGIVAVGGPGDSSGAGNAGIGTDGAAYGTAGVGRVGTGPAH